MNVVWLILFMSSAQFLRQKMKLLDEKTFKSETESINVQNLIIIITLGIMLVNCVIIRLNGPEKLWVILNAIFLYCVAMTLSINYFLCIHNRTFKSASKVRLDSSLTTGESTHNKTVTLHNLSVLAAADAAMRDQVEVSLHQ